MQADRSTQRATTRLCIQCGLFLLQHGAESALVEELSTRLGLALGMDSVESSISSNAIVLTTIKDGQCLTSTRKNHDRGINMHVVTEVQHIVILAEHKLLDLREFQSNQTPPVSALAGCADGGTVLRLLLQAQRGRLGRRCRDLLCQQHRNVCPPAVDAQTATSAN